MKSPLKSATDTISVAECPNTPPPPNQAQTHKAGSGPAEPPAQNLAGSESKQAPRGLQEVRFGSPRGFECLLSWQLLP